VTLAEIDGAGQVRTTKLATPVPRPLHEVRGRLDDLLADGGPASASDLAEAWVRVVLTDPVRPAAPMERLRAKWPHTLVLDFAPDGELTGAATDLSRLARTADPVQICGHFVEFTSGGAADVDQQAVLRDVIEAVLASDRADGLLQAGQGPAGRPSDDLADADSIDEWLAHARRDDDWLAEAAREAGGIGEAGGNTAAA